MATNESPSSKSSPAIPLLLLLAVVLTILGFGLGYMLGGKMQEETSFQAGKDAAEEELNEQLVERGIIAPEETEDAEVTATSGMIVSLDKDSLELRGTFTKGFLAEPTEKTWRVLIDSKTLIQRFTEMTPEDREAEEVRYAEEMTAYDLEIAALGEEDIPPDPPEPPEPFKQKVVRLSDLKEGMAVSVNSDEDISGVDSFTATFISYTESLDDVFETEPVPEAPDEPLIDEEMPRMEDEPVADDMTPPEPPEPPTE